MGSSACHSDLRRKEDTGGDWCKAPASLFLAPRSASRHGCTRQANEQVWWRHKLSDETVELY